MKDGVWTDSRELGLALGILCGRYLLNTQHLHYGYWPEDLPVKLSNLGTAQQCLADLILAHVPSGVSSILDVGCGAGALASQMLSRGYSVDCVCPNPLLAAYARKRLKNASHIYKCRYEALNTNRRYDLVLFSESFQYMRAYKSIAKTLRVCNPGGYLLICDFFKTDAAGECVIGGGRNFARFRELVCRYRCLENLKDIDITRETAPTVDLLNKALSPVAALWQVLRRLSGGPSSPLFAGEHLGARLHKLERKYFSGLRTAQHFSTFKSYRLLLYRLRSTRPPD